MNLDQPTEAPEVDEPLDSPAPAEQVEAPDTPQLPFSLDDLDDDFQLTGADAKAFLLGRQAQIQAPVTRRLQEIAAEREQVAALQELQTRLAADDTRQEALLELAELAGVELEFDNDDAEDPVEYADPLEQEVAELRAWRQQQEEAQAQQQQSVQDQAGQQRFNDHAVTEMQRVAQTLGQTLESMADVDKQDIVARALSAAPRPDGLPDFDAGLASHLQFKDHVAQAERQKYLASKNAPDPGVNGSSGERVTNLRDVNARLAAATAAADKHYISS